MSTRRDFLRRAGAVATPSTATLALAGAAAAKHLEEAKPDHVTITYDQDWLHQYRPKLVLEQESWEKLLGVYGWRVESPEYEYSVGCYVASYSHQEGLSPVSAALAAPLSDSHYGDHEWYYTYVKDGQLQHVVYDAYHWVAGKNHVSTIPTDGQHPVTKVVKPWHMYHHNVSASEGTFFEVSDLTAQFEPWLNNGLEEDLEPGTVVDPGVFGPSIGNGRTHWWRDDVGEFSANAAYARAMYKSGLLGADIRGVSL